MVLVSLYLYFPIARQNNWQPSQSSRGSARSSSLLTRCSWPKPRQNTWCDASNTPSPDTWSSSSTAQTRWMTSSCRRYQPRGGGASCLHTQAGYFYEGWWKGGPKFFIWPKNKSIDCIVWFSVSGGRADGAIRGVWGDPVHPRPQPPLQSARFMLHVGPLAWRRPDRR